MLFSLLFFPSCIICLSVSFAPGCFLDPPVISCAEWNPKSLAESVVWLLTQWPNLKGVLLLFYFIYLFLSASWASRANITQPSNSHACDLTPLAANVFSGAELAWFRADGNFNLPSIIFPIITPFTTISLHPESQEAEKEGIVHSVPNFNMSTAKKKRERESERGGVYTLLGVYYKAAITFRLFSPFPFHSHTLLTGSGRLPWWLDSITCDSFDLMSLSGSLYLFEQLRGNCVTLAVEDVLWRRTRWTEGPSRGSVAIINEGYFPQNAKTLCMCVSVCVSVCSWWGEQDRAMSPSTLGEFNCEMHIEVACTHSDHHFHWSEQNCFCACFLFLSKMSLGVTLRNFRALETSNAVLLVGLGGCWIDLQKHIAF